MIASVFWRAYNRNKARRLSDENVRAMNVTVRDGATLEDIMEAAAKVYGADLRRKGHLGPFEVQVDDGVWTNNERALFNGVKLSSKATFKTWEELDKVGA